MANAADRVYAAIRARIENGAYPSGRRLKEEELAEELGVSRTPVREALRRLRNDQLVRFVPNRGAFVTAWSVEDADQRTSPSKRQSTQEPYTTTPKCLKL